ncbi:MAG: hypothetical protein R3F62_20655 [Planctomycetota bacterium]
MSRLLALVFLLMTAGFAQEGSYRLFGEVDKEPQLTRIFVDRTPAGLRIERTSGPDHEGAKTSTLFGARAETLEDGRIEVDYVERRGVLGALGDEEDVVLRAVYAFAEDGSVSEDSLFEDEEVHFKGYREGPALILEREARLEDLFGDALDRYEASGVVLVDQRVFVVCDNAYAVLSVPSDLDPDDVEVHELDKGHGSSDFEGITVDRRRGRFYAVQEGVKRKGKDNTPRLWELEEDFEVHDRDWLDLELDGITKGAEGLAHVHRDGEDYLFALMEGNDGRDKKAGRERGKGRIEIFRRHKGKFKAMGRIDLPERAFFADYAGIDVRDDRVVVVSQASAQLWVGTLRPDVFEFTDAGRAYRFPEDGSETRYPVMEGVAWLDAQRVVVVSDRPTPPFEAAKHAQESIHVFRLPADE